MARFQASFRRCFWLSSVWFVVAVILAPLLVVFWVSVFKDQIIAFPPQGYSFQWFQRAFQSDAFLHSFILSIQVGFLATSISLLVGIPVSLVLARTSMRGVAVIRGLVTLPLIVPGVVVGSSMYMFFIEFEIRTGTQVAGTFYGLVAAHAVLTLPWVVRLILSSLAMRNATLEEASMNLGANRFTTFYRVTLPSIRPGIVAGALFGFIVSLADLEISLFLVGAGKTTLSIAILNYLQWGLDPTIAAVATIQIIIVGTALLISDRFVNLSRII